MITKFSSAAIHCLLYNLPDMRVTFVLPAVDLSGGVRVASIYAEGLRRRGHRVHVVSVRKRRPTWKYAVRSWWNRQGWPRTARSPSHFDDLPLEHRRLGHTGPVTDADVPDADVVIGTWWETVRWVAALSPAKGVKVHFVQGYDAHGGTSAAIDAIYTLPIPKIVISKWLRDLVQNSFGQTPVAVIPNGVEIDRFYSPPRSKPTIPTIGMIYNPLRIKGADISILAYRLLERDAESSLEGYEPLPAPSTVAIAALRGVFLPCARPTSAGCLFRLRCLAIRLQARGVWVADSRSHGLPHSRHRDASRRRSRANRARRRGPRAGGGAGSHGAGDCERVLARRFRMAGPVGCRSHQCPRVDVGGCNPTL